MGMGRRGREIAKGGNEEGSLWALQDQTTTTGTALPDVAIV